MVKKVKRVAASTSVKMVKYRTMETTRGTRTKLLKLTPSRQNQMDRALQGSPSKVQSLGLAAQFDQESSSSQCDEDHGIPPIQFPKHKVSDISCLMPNSLLKRTTESK